MSLDKPKELREAINDLPIPLNVREPVEEAQKPVLEAMNDTPTEYDEETAKIEEAKPSSRQVINESSD